jgi:hypothetical protein
VGTFETCPGGAAGVGAAGSAAEEEPWRGGRAGPSRGDGGVDACTKGTARGGSVRASVQRRCERGGSSLLGIGPEKTACGSVAAVLTETLDCKLSLKRSRFVAAALALSLLLPAGSAFAQSDEDKAAARVLATQGAEALGAGKYAEALDLVSRAEQMFHAPTHLLLIARSQAGVGRLVAAKETYLKLTREELPASAPPAFKRAQQDGKDEMAALEANIASLRIAVEGGGQQKFTVKMDDQPVSPALLGVYRPVDPGKHDVVVFPVGQGPVKGSVVLKNGEKKDIKLTIPDVIPGGVPVNPIDNPDQTQKPGGDKVEPTTPGFMTPLRGVGIGASVVGVGGIALGVVFLLKKSSTQSDADAKQDLCVAAGKGCTKAMRDQIHALDVDAASAGTIAAVSVAAGGVALAAGVTLLVIGKPRPKAAATMTPWFTGNMGGVQGTF